MSHVASIFVSLESLIHLLVGVPSDFSFQQPISWPFKTTALVFQNAIGQYHPLPSSLSFFHSLSLILYISAIAAIFSIDIQLFIIKIESFTIRRVANRGVEEITPIPLYVPIVHTQLIVQFHIINERAQLNRAN